MHIFADLILSYPSAFDTEDIGHWDSNKPFLDVNTVFVEVIYYSN